MTPTQARERAENELVQFFSDHVRSLAEGRRIVGVLADYGEARVLEDRASRQTWFWRSLRAIGLVA